MANRRMDPVGYRPFRVEPLLADGLLAVSRPGGELEQRVADGFFNLAAQAGQFADQQAETAGRAAGLRDALAGGPKGEYRGEVGGAGRVRGAKFSAEVNDAIHQAAVKYGVPEKRLQRFAQIESGGNPKAHNAGSGAAGLFQFIPSTAKAYGLADPFDAYANADAAARLYRDNARHLQAKLGRAPSAGEVYLAHQQGAGGAVKLIANAGRPASAVVGARAVRSNGGTPAMSAGQFASMWIKKVDGGYSLPDHPDQITTAAVNSPMTGNVVLAGGRFRPRGSNTIYDRAYDEAGTRTYLQMLETEMRSTTSQAFDLYKDDPAKLASVLGDLRTKIGQDQVFPEIQADYETGFDRLAGSYVEQARDNATKKQESQDRADFIGRTGELQTDVARKIEQLDPANPDTANAIASAQAGIDEHYDSAVRRGIMDPDDAARAKLESRRDAAVGFYAKQADALDADGVKAMREKMATDFGGGGVAGLDGDGWGTLKAKLENVEADKRRQQQQSAQDYRTKGDTFAARIAAGLDVAPADLATYALAAGKTPQGKVALQETYAKISAGKAVNDMTLKQAEAHVAGLRQQYGKDATPAQLRTLNFAEDMLAKKRKAISSDPVTYAEQRGIVAPTPFITEAQSTDEVAGIVTARIANAATAAQEFGTAPRFLKAGEAKAVAAAIKASPEQGAGLAAAIVAGAGAHAPDVLAEFGQDAPVISEAGSILAFGGSARAAEDVILGYGKSADGKAQTGLKPADAAATYGDVAGGALALAKKDGDRIGRAAASIARKRITEEGVDPTSDEAKDIYSQAVQEAAGATFDKGVQWGGFATVGAGIFGGGGSQVLVPPTMRADKFEEVLGAITDKDLAALPVKPKPGAGVDSGGRAGTRAASQGLAETLRGAVPVIVRGGYAFAFGDPASDDPQFVQDEKGGVFVLDLAALAPDLAKRMPEAFR